MDTPYQTHGAPSWIELQTDDVAGAKAFYSELFGWTLESMPMGPGTYEVIKVGDEQIGGITASEGQPTRWVSYITVDDVDARAKQAASSGGKLLNEPFDIPGVGRFATIEDANGAVISLIAYSDEVSESS